MRTTVELPDDLFRQAKASAALRGIKLRDLITECLSRGLDSDDAPVAEPSIRRVVRAPAKGDVSSPLPSLTPEQVRRMFNEEEARVYLAARRRLAEKAASQDS